MISGSKVMGKLLTGCTNHELQNFNLFLLWLTQLILHLHFLI